MQSHPLDKGAKVRPWGTECPQLSLQSAGLDHLSQRLSLDTASLRGVLQRKTSASAPSNGSLLQTINSGVNSRMCPKTPLYPLNKDKTTTDSECNSTK